MISTIKPLANRRYEKVSLAMKQIIVLFIIASISGSCASVKKFNRDLKVLHAEKDLVSDIDYVYDRLQKLHPQLYLYTSKEDLDFKFDSLKSSIIAPMSSTDFYFKLSPVIASVKQGHTLLHPLNKEITLKELFDNGTNGRSALHQLDFDLFDNKLYVVKNNSGNNNINVGSEIIKINNYKPQDLISKYRNTVSSDGFNLTYVNRKLSNEFADYFFNETGFVDSIACQFIYNDTVKTVLLRHKKRSLSRENMKSREQKASEKETRKKDSKKREEQGYNWATKTYTKDLSFLETDSSIALLRINNFYDGNYVEFYSRSFKLLDSLKTKNLILDLRDNPGGKLIDAKVLFSYLVDSTFIFVEKSEVVSKNSILKANYFKGNPWYLNVLLGILYPRELLSRGFSYLLLNRKEEGNTYYYHTQGSIESRPKANNYKGNLYVIITGGSFSAASILAANLRALQNVVFVGEETGGAANGAVAGKMALYILPESKLKISFGLLAVKPFYQTGTEGRGILPDIVITPTVEDKINEVDPELEWIFNDIDKRTSKNLEIH